MANYHNKDKDFSKLRLETQLVRSGTIRSNFGETSEAIYLNSGFCYDSAEIAESRFNGEDPGYVYSRYVNPSLKMLENRLATIEKAEACCVMASGMAAVFGAMMCQLKTGDHILASRVLFGSCYHIITKILPNYGITYSLVDGVDENAWRQAFATHPKSKLVFIESPANPNLELIDIKFVSDICKAHGSILIVDNIFASPLLQHPLELGADIVVYSTTKHIDGGGRTLGGAVLASEEFIKETLLPFHRHTGPCMSPFNAWVILKSLETLSLIMTQHSANALAIATFLETSKSIERVIYPHLPSHPQYNLAKKQMSTGGNMIAIVAKNGKDGAFALMNRLQLVDISNNLGDSKSLITHPASTTHSNLSYDEQMIAGISSGMLRLSVGLENYQDLIDDFTMALV